MITEKERSCAHLSLLCALNVRDNSTSESDIRKAGLALAVSRYGGTPELAKLLAVADAIDDRTWGGAASFEVQNVMAVTGLDKPMSENVLMMIGARQREVLTWSVGDGGNTITLPHDLMRLWLKTNLEVVPKFD